MHTPPPHASVARSDLLSARSCETFSFRTMEAGRNGAQRSSNYSNSWKLSRRPKARGRGAKAEGCSSWNPGPPNVACNWSRCKPKSVILCLLQKLKNLLSWQRKLRQTLCHPRQLILLLLLHVVHLRSFRCGLLLEGGVFSLVTFCCWCWCGFWCAVDSGSGSGSSWYLLVSQQCKCRSSSSSSSLLLLPLLCLFAVCSRCFKSLDTCSTGRRWQQSSRIHGGASHPQM